MAEYHGDIRLGETIDIKFCTVGTTGAPTQLAGTPVVSAYVGNGTTEITAGITLTVDFDGRTGLNNVRVVASGGNGFAAATNVELVITTGTVGGTSVVGYCVGSFSIENRSAVMPTTAGRTLDVSAGGEAGVDWANVGGQGTAVSLSATDVRTATNVETDTQDIQNRLPAALVGGRIDANTGAISGDATAADNLETAFDDTAGAVPWVGIIDQGTAQSASGNNIVLRAAAAFPDNNLEGKTIMVFGSTQGYWQAALIASNVLATDTVTVTPPTGWVTPSGTITYKIFGTAPGASGGGLDAAGVRAAIGMASANMDTQLAGIQSDTNDIQSRLPAALVSGRMDSSVGAMAANVMTAAAANADLGTELAGAVRTELATELGRIDVATSTRATPTNVSDAQAAIQTDIAALNDVSQAEVKAQVVSALNTDTYAEPGQGAPAATASIVTKLGYVYKAWRNRHRQTASEYELFADDGTTRDQLASFTSNGTEAVRGEVGTGA